MLSIQLRKKNRLRKERKRSLSKGMLNVYLKVSNETFLKRRFTWFKTFRHQVSFGELQLTQISLNFKTSCCNLKFRPLEVKL